MPYLSRRSPHLADFCVLDELSTPYICGAFYCVWYNIFTWWLALLIFFIQFRVLGTDY